MKFKLNDGRKWYKQVVSGTFLAASVLLCAVFVSIVLLLLYIIVHTMIADPVPVIIQILKGIGLAITIIIVMVLVIATHTWSTTNK